MARKTSRAPEGSVDATRVRGDNRNAQIRALKQEKLRQMEGRRPRLAPRKGDVDSDDDETVRKSNTKMPDGCHTAAVQEALDNDLSRVASGDSQEGERSCMLQ